MKIITYFKSVSYGCIKHTLRTFQELNIRGVVGQISQELYVKSDMLSVKSDV